MSVWNGTVTQGFGPTSEQLDGPYNGYAHFNKGIDLGVPVGTPVDVRVGGTVVAAGDQGDGWGYSVKVKDAQGNTHNYGHLSSIGVKAGDVVKPGQVIAKSGGAKGAPGSGSSTGPHLSYDVWDSSGKFIDPSPFVKGGSVTQPTSDSQVKSYIEERIGPEPKASDPKYKLPRPDPANGKILRPATAAEIQAAYQADLELWHVKANDLAGSFKALVPEARTGEQWDPERQTAAERAGRYARGDYEFDVQQGWTAIEAEMKKLDQQVQAGKLDADVAAQKLQAMLTGRDQADREAELIQSAQEAVMKYGVPVGKERQTAEQWGPAFAVFAKLLGQDPSTSVPRDFTGQTITLDPEGDIRRLRAMNEADGPLPQLPGAGHFAELVSQGQKGYGWTSDSPPPDFETWSGGGGGGGYDAALVSQDTGSAGLVSPPAPIALPTGYGATGGLGDAVTPQNNNYRLTSENWPILPLDPPARPDPYARPTAPLVSRSEPVMTAADRIRRYVSGLSGGR